MTSVSVQVPVPFGYGRKMDKGNVGVRKKINSIVAPQFTKQGMTSFPVSVKIKEILVEINFGKPCVRKDLDDVGKEIIDSHKEFKIWTDRNNRR